MAKQHTVTAIKAQTRDDVMTISLMTRSPRGTQVPFKSIKVDKLGKTKAVFINELASELQVLLAGEIQVE